MASCVKCWSDAHRGDQFSVAEEYRRLLTERDAAGRPCTPEQQAGGGGLCVNCYRWTVHMHTGQCIICGEIETDALQS